MCKDTTFFDITHFFAKNDTRLQKNVYLCIRVFKLNTYLVMKTGDNALSFYMIISDLEEHKSYATTN